MSGGFVSHSKGLSSGAFKSRQTPAKTFKSNQTPAKTFMGNGPGGSARKALGDVSNRRAFGDITNKKAGGKSGLHATSKTKTPKTASKKVHKRKHRPKNSSIEYAPARVKEAEYDNPELSAELDRCFADIFKTHAHGRAKNRPMTPSPCPPIDEIPADTPVMVDDGADDSMDALNLDNLLGDLDLAEDDFELDVSLDTSVLSIHSHSNDGLA